MKKKTARRMAILAAAGIGAAFALYPHYPDKMTPVEFDKEAWEAITALKTSGQFSNLGFGNARTGLLTNHPSNIILWPTKNAKTTDKQKAKVVKEMNHFLEAEGYSLRFGLPRSLELEALGQKSRGVIVPAQTAKRKVSTLKHITSGIQTQIKYRKIKSGTMNIHIAPEPKRPSPQVVWTARNKFIRTRARTGRRGR